MIYKIYTGRPGSGIIRYGKLIGAPRVTPGTCLCSCIIVNNIKVWLFRESVPSIPEIGLYLPGLIIQYLIEHGISLLRYIPSPTKCFKQK